MTSTNPSRRVYIHPDFQHLHSVCKEVLRTAHHGEDSRRGTVAVYRLFGRIATSANSLGSLLDTIEDRYIEDRSHFEARSLDCLVILRCMYDALIQAEYIATSDDPDMLGNLYAEYVHVEMYRGMTAFLEQDDALSKRLQMSPRRIQSEPQFRREYDRVRGLFPKSKEKPQRVRSHWYEGDFPDIAHKVRPSRKNEALWLFRNFHSAVHSGPRSTLGQSAQVQEFVECACLTIVARGASSLKKLGGLRLCQFTESFIQTYDKDFIEAVAAHFRRPTP